MENSILFTILANNYRLLKLNSHMIYKLQNGGTYTHNDYYGYVNKIQEKAISNPEWFWSDAQDASEARQWLYNNNASSIVENIYNNTPEEFRSTINSKYLPTNIQQNNFNSGITSTTTDAAKDIGKAALAAGSIGMTGAGLLPIITEGWTAGIPFMTGLAGSGIGSISGGIAGAFKGEYNTVRDFNNTPKDTTSLQNGISTITGYDKSIPYSDREIQNVLSGVKKGTAIGGLIGGLYGGIKGTRFKNLMDRNFDWNQISSNLNQYHTENGTTFSTDRFDWFKKFKYNNTIQNLSDYLSKTKIRTENLGLDVDGVYHNRNNIISLNRNPFSILFQNTKGTLAHEGEHAVQDIIHPFWQNTRVNKPRSFGTTVTKEIPEQPVGKLFEKSLGRRNKLGSWGRGPNEFDAEMASMRQTTGQNKPYSQMRGFPKWFTRNYMKLRFRLNNKDFNTATRAQEQALKDPQAPIE